MMIILEVLIAYQCNDFAVKRSESEGLVIKGLSKKGGSLNPLDPPLIVLQS